MSIQKEQIKKTEEIIYNKVLKSGSEVTANYMKTQIDKFLQNNTIGEPTFSPLYVEQRSTSDKEKYNKVFSEIDFDLNIAFDVLRNQVEYILNYQGKHEELIQDIDNELSLLNLNIEALQEAAESKSTHASSYVMNFTDLLNINLKEDISKNIFSTTSEIDFNTSIVRNKLYSQPNDKIDLTNSKVIISSSDKLIDNTEITNLLSDSFSKTTRFNFLNSSRQKYKELQIEIKLEDSVYASRLDITGYFLDGYDISLSLSDDGVNYIEKAKKQCKSNNSFKFNKTKISSFKINFKKIKEGESFNENYLILIAHISLYNDKYSKSSSLITEPFKIKTTTPNLLLHPIHDIPSSTSIIYFLGIEDVTGVVMWNMLSLDKAWNIGLLNKDLSILYNGSNQYYGQSINDKNKKMYRLDKLKRNYNPNSINLQVGYGQWLVEKLDSSLKLNQEQPKINLLDYKKDNVVAIAPLSASSTEIDCKDIWNYLVLSQNLECNDEIFIKNKFIRFNKEDEVFEYKLLLNGKQIIEKEGYLNFNLSRGNNELKLIILLGNHSPSVESSKKIYHNLNLSSPLIKICGAKKSNFIDYNSMMKNISNRVLDLYSVQKDEESNEFLVTKFNPNFPENQESSLNDIKISRDNNFKIYLSYEYMDEEVKNKFSKDGENILVRVMAKLNTNDISTTPSINSIKVVSS